MTGFGDQIMQQVIDAKCPGCGHTVRFTLRQLQRGDSVVCGGCGQKIELTNSGDDLRRIERAGNDLSRQISKLGR